MRISKLFLSIAFITGLFILSCKDDDDNTSGGGAPASGGNPQDTAVVSSDGYTLIHEDASGDATMFVQGQQDPVSGGMDGTKIEYLYNDTADKVTFRITVVNLADFSSSPSFDFSFLLPNGTVPTKPTGLPFRGTTMTHRTASVYTDDGGTAPSTYTYNQTDQFAINGMGFTGEFGNPPQLDNLKSICENCIDISLDVPNKQIYATIDRKLIIKDEEMGGSGNSASIKLVSNVGFRRGNNDLVVDGEEFLIQLRDSSSVDTTMNTLANVSTDAVNNVTRTTAMVSANVSDIGSSDVTERGICYSETANPTINESTVASGNGSGSYSATLQNLKQGTTYYARAYATNGTGTAYGNELTFTTLKNDTTPTVTTDNVIDITNSSGRLLGTIVDNGNRTITEKGFLVTEMPNPNPTLDSVFRARVPGSAIGSFRTNVTILPSNSTFYVRAYAINDLGVGFGDEIQFTTTDSTTRPTALTTIAINITRTSALCGVRVVDNGNSPVTEAGLVYSTSPNPTLADNVLMVPNVNPNPDGYGIVLSNLQPGTRYYFKGYAKNAFGTYFGQELEFTTQP